jgi:hypothetical protein
MSQPHAPGPSEEKGGFERNGDVGHSDRRRAGRLAQGERTLHKGEVVGSIPTAPTSNVKDLAGSALKRAHVSPMKPY